MRQFFEGLTHLANMGFRVFVLYLLGYILTDMRGHDISLMGHVVIWSISVIPYINSLFEKKK